MGIAFYYIIFLVLIFFSFVEKCLKNKYFIYGLAAVIAIFLALVAGLRNENVSRDYVSYVSYIKTFISFNHYIQNPAYYDFNEPGIFLVAAVMQLFSITTIKFLFIIYASIALLLKIRAFFKLSEWVCLSFALLFTNYYLLHEMTQIRTAVATGFFLLAIPNIVNREFVPFCFKILISLIFHYSAIIFLPLYFLNPNKFNKVVNVSLLLIPICLGVLNVDLLTILTRFDLGVYTTKIELYSNMVSAGIYDTINKFNAIILLRISIALFAIYYSEKLMEVSKAAPVILKIYILSIASFYLFSNIPAIAFRVYEMLGIVEVILLPFLVFVFKEKLIGLITVLGYGLISLIINLHVSKLVNPYF